MNSSLRKLSRFAKGLVLLCMAWPLALRAFPPAPNHLIFGSVRDQIGNPIDIHGAEILLDSSAGGTVSAQVIPQLDPGINYRLEIPMDAGLTADLYKPTALLPAAPFRLRVRIGQTIYLPMEMAGSFSNLGLPGDRTRIDLTLGVDADGNGLPDAWERAAAAFLGLTWAPGVIRPGDLYPGAGLTFRDVYLAGTYAVDPIDGFALKIITTTSEGPRLAFTAVKGRSYIIEACSELGEWSAVPFRVLPVGEESPIIEAFQATVTQRIEIEAPSGASESPTRFYRLIVQ